MFRPKALEIQDATHIFEETTVPHFSATPGVETSIDLELTDPLRALDLDFILNFACSSACGPILDVARWGLWSFREDDLSRAARTPPEFWTLYNRLHTTDAALCQLGPSPGSSRRLRWGRLRAIRSNYALHIDRLYAEMAEWPAWVCGVLMRDPGRLSTFEKVLDVAHVPAAPSATQERSFAGRIAGRRLRRALRRPLYREEWNVGIVQQPIETLAQCGGTPEINWLQQGEAPAFWADPFGLEEFGQRWIFFEAFDYDEERGWIAATALSDSNAPSEPYPIWRWPFHTSYPFLFRHDGEIYCIPETSEANSVRLHRALRFPKEWEEVTCLIEDCAVVDASVFRFADRWWLTCADASGDAATRLLLYHADELAGPWRAHRHNPLKVDVASARPAGAPFVVDGVLYRPAQDCSTGYGARVVVHRVDRLDLEGFDEHAVSVVEPAASGPYPDGLHTLSALGDCTLVDGRRMTFDLAGAPRRILAKLVRGVGARGGSEA